VTHLKGAAEKSLPATANDRQPVEGNCGIAAIERSDLDAPGHWTGDLERRLDDPG